MKLNLSNITSGYGAVAALNANFDAIEQAVENTLSRDGTTPNEMLANLDMNGNDILNADTINTASLVINGTPVQPATGVTVASAFQSHSFVATAGQTAFSLAPYTPYSASVQVEVNGLSLPPADISVSGTNVVIPACTAGDEVVIRRYTDVPSPFPNANDVLFNQTGTVQTRSVQNKLRDSLNAKDYGVIGDGVADDTAAFVAACAAAVSANKPLNIGDLKIYLASQSASIPSDGLYLVGSGFLKGQISGNDTNCIVVDWLYEAGTSGRFAINKATMSAFSGSVIFSQYNGPIFTGKTFSGENFTVIGDPLFANSQCFKQTTPTGYPGWSQPFLKLKDFSCAYFGSHGLQAMGGSELTTIKNVSSSFCKGYCLYIGQTSGVNCPIEYLDIDGGWFSGGLLGNIYLEGVSKQIQVHNTQQLAPGQLPRRAAGGFVVASRADIVFPIRMRPAPGSLIISAVDISVYDNVSEETQGILSMQDALSGFPYWYDVEVRDNYFIPYNNTWPFYSFQIDGTFAVNVTTMRNFTPSGVRMYFVPSANHNGFDIQERFTSNGVTIDGALLNDSQYIRPRIYPGDSGSLGDGTANYFQTTIFADSFTTPSNKAAVPTLYLISADNQGTGVGAYLLAAFRTNSGQWYGTTCAFGSTSGFNGAPGILTNGAIFANTNANYRVRVKRIDMGVVNPATY